MTRLDIYTKEGIQLDLTTDTKVVFNFQVANLNEITNRQCSYTNTFTLPATDKNIGLLRGIGRVQTVIINGADYFTGYLIIKREKANKEGFEVNFYSEMFNFKEEIKDLNINQLDFSEYNFQWSLGEDLSPNLATYLETTEGLVTLIDYENITGTNTIKYNDSSNVLGAVGIYFKTLIQKMFEYAGWTYSGNILDDDLFNSLVMPLCSRTGVKPEQFYVSVESDKSYDYSLLYPSEKNITEIFKTETSDIYNKFDYDIGYTLNVAGTVKVWVQIVCNKDSATINFKMKESTAPYDIFDLYSYNSYKKNGQHIHNCYFFNTNNNYFTKTFTVWAFDDSLAIYKLIIYSAKMTFEMTELSSDVITYLNPYIINSNLPSAKFSDVLKIFYQLFFVMPIADAKAKHIEFVKFTEIVENTSDAVDVSEMIDYKTIETTRLSSYGQKNYARYLKSAKVDYDFSVFRSVNNDALIDTKEFLPVKMIGTVDYNNIIYDLTVTALDFTENQFRLISVLHVDDATKSLTVVRQDLVSFPITKYVVPHFRSAPQIVYSLDLNYILDTYYNRFFKMLNNYEVLNLQMQLLDLNVSNVDITKLYYIKDKGAYYYVNNISQYESKEQLTKVELIKIT